MGRNDRATRWIWQKRASAGVAKMMKAGAVQFRVSRILEIPSRPGIFVCGEIVAGIIRPGMLIVWSLPSGTMALAHVRAVEFVDRWPDGAEITLRVTFDHDEERNEQLLRDTLSAGSVVFVLDALRVGGTTAARTAAAGRTSFRRWV